MICVKGRDHRYQLVNREFELAHGRSAAWIIGRSDADLIAPARLREVRAKDLAVLDSGVSSQEEETTVDEAGVTRVRLNTRFPLPDADGRLTPCVSRPRTSPNATRKSASSANGWSARS